MLSDLARQFFKNFSNTSRFDKMSNTEVYDFFDYQLNTISINTAKDMKVEDVWFDDAFVDELNKAKRSVLTTAKTARASIT